MRDPILLKKEHPFAPATMGLERPSAVGVGPASRHLQKESWEWVSETQQKGGFILFFINGINNYHPLSNLDNSEEDLCPGNQNSKVRGWGAPYLMQRALLNSLLPLNLLNPPHSSARGREILLALWRGPVIVGDPLFTFINYVLVQHVTR